MFGFGRRAAEEQARADAEEAEAIAAAAELERAQQSQARAVELQRQVTMLVRRANQNSRALTPTGMVAFHEVVVPLRSLLDYLSRNSVTAVELQPVVSLVEDYFPNTVENFLRVDTNFALSETLPSGLTTAETFYNQLNLLSMAVLKLRRNIDLNTSRAVQSQSKFFDSLFANDQELL